MKCLCVLCDVAGGLRRQIDGSELDEHVVDICSRGIPRWSLPFHPMQLLPAVLTAWCGGGRARGGGVDRYTADLLSCVRFGIRVREATLKALAFLTEKWRLAIM